MSDFLPHYGSNSKPVQDSIRIARGDNNLIYEFPIPFELSEISAAEYIARVKTSSEPGTGAEKINIHSDIETTQWTWWDDGDTNRARLTFKYGDTLNLRLAANSVNEIVLDFRIVFYLNDAGPVTVRYGTTNIEPLAVY